MSAEPYSAEGLEVIRRTMVDAGFDVTPYVGARLLATIEQRDAKIREQDAQQDSILEEIRVIARIYTPPQPGMSGYEVEGRVIASDLFALADWYDLTISQESSKS